MPVIAKTTPTALRHELVDRQTRLYEGPDIDGTLETLIQGASTCTLSWWDIHRMLRTARAVYFDTHVEVVSGHHTATHLRFESIARFPQLITLIARDMAEWVGRTFAGAPPDGIVAPSSGARLLAERVGELLADRMPLKIVLAPFNDETGKIGTDIPAGVIGPGERFLALNDVTTRGMCVSKLGKIVTDHGGRLGGMMVFARRDSGQFPLMDELTAAHPFYWCADLAMPQWEPADCSLCKNHRPLLMWKDLPEL
jgi:orotate phosphoribosyltransferase